MDNNLRASITADITYQQDIKLKDLDTKLKKIIQTVAESPVQLHLTPEIKKTLLNDVNKLIVEAKSEIYGNVKKGKFSS